MKNQSYREVIADFEKKRKAKLTNEDWAKSTDFVRETCLSTVLEQIHCKDFDKIDFELQAYVRMCKVFEQNEDNSLSLKESLIITLQAMLEDNKVILTPQVNMYTNVMVDAFDSMNNDSWTRL